MRRLLINNRNRHSYCTTIMYGVRWTVDSVSRPVYGVHCTLYSIQCTVNSVRRTVYTVQCTVYGVYYIIYDQLI